MVLDGSPSPITSKRIDSRRYLGVGRGGIFTYRSRGLRAYQRVLSLFPVIENQKAVEIRTTNPSGIGAGNIPVNVRTSTGNSIAESPQTIGWVEMAWSGVVTTNRLSFSGVGDEKSYLRIELFGGREHPQPQKTLYDFIAKNSTREIILPAVLCEKVVVSWVKEHPSSAGSMFQIQSRLAIVCCMRRLN